MCMSKTNMNTYHIPIFIGLIHVFEVNIRRGPKNGLTPECEARGC